MHNAIPLTVAALIAVGIIVIGCFYLVSPERISGTFGLKPPASDADTRAWLRPKGIRDIVAGLVVLTMMLTADTRMVGIALLVEAVIHSGVGRVEVASVLHSWGNLRGDDCRWPLVDPCYLRRMPHTDLWCLKDGKLIEH
jgi:hypothetical protein